MSSFCQVCFERITGKVYQQQTIGDVEKGIEKKRMFVCEKCYKIGGNNFEKHKKMSEIFWDGISQFWKN